LVTVKDTYTTVVDVGCGTARELVQLASVASPKVQFIGVEPAANMRKIAAARTDGLANVQILGGSFEDLPLERESVDYLYSLLAFHWTTDLGGAVAELGRVMTSRGEMDLSFVGRHNGREFIQKTTPVFFKYMSPAAMVKAASLRKQLTLEQATTLFRQTFDSSTLSVEESYHTYYDTLDGHWGWWVRIEGQLLEIPSEKKEECDQAVRAAISTLTTDEGIPYTVHLIHVRIRR
jgi:ubiquinone/menaquinone biosynthesis C-methylase UbiE